MPRIRVVFYKEDDGAAPFVQWFEGLQDKVRDKCMVKIERLGELGHELRSLLRDGIYELRTKRGHVQYRILYFFHGQVAAVISHGLTKTRSVPPREINKAIGRKRKFFKNPGRRTWEEER